MCLCLGSSPLTVLFCTYYMILWWEINSHFRPVSSFFLCLSLLVCRPQTLSLEQAPPTPSKHKAMPSIPESFTLCGRCHVPAPRSTCASNKAILMDSIKLRGPSHFRTRTTSTWRRAERLSTQPTTSTSRTSALTNAADSAARHRS